MSRDDHDSNEVPPVRGFLKKLLWGLGISQGEESADSPPDPSPGKQEEDQATYPIRIQPLAPPQVPEESIDRIPVFLAIDLGTSASAVVWSRLPDRPPADIPVPVNFGELGQRSALVGGQAPLVGSQILFSRVPLHGEGKNKLGGRQNHCFLGAVADEIQQAHPDHSTSYYTSVKRLLDLPSNDGEGRDSTPLFNLPGVVEAVFQELLLMALVPQHSETVQGYAMLHGDSAPGVGFPERHRTSLCRRVLQEGLTLFVTIPNSFSHREVKVLENAAEMAGKEVMRVLRNAHQGLQGPLQERPTVRLLRESEAIAWWEHSLDRHERKRGGTTRSKDATPERWLVFDMGAGTTDLALLEVEERDIHLVRRSGIPVGGDDFDLVFCQHIEPGTVLCDALKKHLPEVPTAMKKVEDMIALRGLSPGERWHPDRLCNLNYLDRVAVKSTAEHCKRLWSMDEGWKSFVVGDDDDVDGGMWKVWTRDTLERRRSVSMGVDDLQDRELLMVPMWARPYRQLVLLITKGCCLGLGGEEAPVNRVILSGRSARLPGIKKALVAVLRQSGLANDETRVDWVRGTEEGGGRRAEDAKLAVARGAATYAWEFDYQDTPARMSEQIVATALNWWEKVVVDLNTQLDPMGRCRALYRMARPERQSLLFVYRQRIPKPVVDELRQGDTDQERLDIETSTFCRKRLFVKAISSGGGEVWYGFQLDEQKGRVSLFEGDGRGDLSYIEPDIGEPPDILDHPVTGLPEDWQWSGEGNPTTQGEHQ